MVSGQDPMVQRRRLRVELRKARESAGLSQRDVAPDMDWSLSKLIRIETGTVGISVNDLRVLLNLYGITDPARVAELVDMARSAREPAWWARYKDAIPPEFAAFLSYESAASIVRSFEPIMVPGLLQTEEYARATLNWVASRPQQPGRTESERIDSLVELRLERQERLAQRAEQTKAFFAIDEGVLHRWVGGPDTMRRQLIRIRETVRSGEHVVWIVPHSHGIYPRMRSPYLMFELPTVDGAEDVLYLEGVRGDLIIRDDTGDAAIYLESFWNLEQIGVKDAAAEALIERAIARLDEAVPTPGTSAPEPSDPSPRTDPEAA